MRAALSVAGISLFLAFCVLLYVRWHERIPDDQQLFRVFYFSPVDDNQYENPNNWTPYYPGTFIKPNQQAIIQGHVNVPFYDLHIEGILKIALDATVFSPNSQIIVNKGGEIRNDGEIIVRKIYQQGRINNHFTGKINVNHFESVPHSTTSNLMGGELVVNYSFLNQGEFNNYGDCQVRMRFENKADFNQLGSSSLVVAGKTYGHLIARVLP